MSKTFRPISGPFGGVDEMKTQEAFVDFLGSVQRAERLMQISNSSYSCGTEYDRVFKTGFSRTKGEVFRAKAKREGFTDAEIDAFLSL